MKKIMMILFLFSSFISIAQKETSTVSELKLVDDLVTVNKISELWNKTSENFTNINIDGEIINFDNKNLFVIPTTDFSVKGFCYKQTNETGKTSTILTFMDGGNGKLYPIIVKSTLFEKKIITKSYDFNLNCFSTIIINTEDNKIEIPEENNKQGLKMAQSEGLAIAQSGNFDCGSLVAQCISNSYTNHSWFSVGLAIVTAFVPATTVGVAWSCTVAHCIPPYIHVPDGF